MMNFDRTPASVLILGAILLMSALALWVAPALLDRNLLRPYWLVRRRQYDTIITSGFIHGDFGHLLFNSLTFYFFAPGLERRIGTPKFFALYFLGLVFSSLGTVYKQRNNPDYAALGDELVEHRFDAHATASARRVSCAACSAAATVPRATPSTSAISSYERSA